MSRRESPGRRVVAGAKAVWRAVLALWRARRMSVVRASQGPASFGDAVSRYAEAATGGTGSGRMVYLARPNRPVLVADSLDELTGPEHGVVELPQRLMWNPNRRFDLDDPDLLLWMYENVLREAIRRTELRRWINGRVLVRVWRKLNLPRPVRQAWESRHAQLRAAA